MDGSDDDDNELKQLTHPDIRQPICRAFRSKLIVSRFLFDWWGWGLGTSIDRTVGFGGAWISFGFVDFVSWRGRYTSRSLCRWAE